MCSTSWKRTRKMSGGRYMRKMLTFTSAGEWTLTQCVSSSCFSTSKLFLWPSLMKSNGAFYEFGFMYRGVINITVFYLFIYLFIHLLRWSVLISQVSPLYNSYRPRKEKSNTLSSRHMKSSVVFFLLMLHYRWCNTFKEKCYPPSCACISSQIHTTSYYRCDWDGRESIYLPLLLTWCNSWP